MGKKIDKLLLLFFFFDVVFRCLPGKRGNIHFKLSSRARPVTKRFDVMLADRAISGCLSAKCNQTYDFGFPPDAGDTFQKNQSA